MTEFKVNPIGAVHSDESGSVIELYPEYRAALQALDGFSHISVIWWFDGCDNETARSILTVEKPYKKSPETMGIFATRSPARPNPIALTAVEVIQIDNENGLIRLAYIDADDGTPVLDLKPYTPSLDRVESPDVPDWCAHWPRSVEESGCFDWENEFNF